MEETQGRPLGREDPLEGDGNPLQYSCLENPMDREAPRATGQGVGKSQPWLSTTHISGKHQLHSSSSLDKSYGNAFNSFLSSNSASIQSVTLSTPHATLHWCSGQIPQPPLPASHRNLKQAPSFHPHTLMPTMNTGAGLGLLRYTIQGLHVASGLVHNSSSRRPSKSGLLLAALLISPLLLGLWPHWPPSVPQADQVAPPWRLTLARSWV